MRPTQTLHHEGQSLWLDNITRDLLTNGTLRRYIDELGITGLTSNPTIFDKAFLSTPAYDAAIRDAADRGLTSEEIFFEIALDDLRHAADLFRDIHEHTHGLDGWVSLEVSPDLADDAHGTLAAAIELHGRAERSNLFIKIPGTEADLGAIEDAIFAGVPVNVTLLFDHEQYIAAAEAYLRGIERRLDAGLDPAVGSVASVFVSRWDTAAESANVAADLSNRLGIAMARETYAAYRDVLASDRFGRLANEGALPQRLLWASTGTKDTRASDVLYVRSLAAPLTINTMPEPTLLAFGDHGEVGDLLSADTTDGEEVIERFVSAGIDTAALARRLQQEAAEAFQRSWAELMRSIELKSTAAEAAR
jgi:transaldolase